jgi:hypothetical protein
VNETTVNRETTVNETTESSHNTTEITTIEPTTTTESTTESTTTTTTTTTETPRLSKNDYFSYGLNHSSLINVTGQDDFTYGDYAINPSFRVLGQSFSSFFISVDGKVFMRNSLSYGLRLFPFDGDIDMRRNGAIRRGLINESEMLDSIGADIRELCKMESFTPTWAYAVTWFECRPYYKYQGDVLYGAKSNYKDTFQLLMTTNGRDSFAFYNYIQMDWPNNVIFDYFEAGFSMVDNVFRSTKVVYENKVVRNLVEKSNMGKPGRWFITFNNTNCRF